MPKRKERSGEEWFRGQLREKEKEIRALQRRIKELERRQHFYQDVVEDVADSVEESKKPNCPKCRKGFLTESDLKFVVLDVCNNCDYREKRKTKRTKT